MAGDGREHASFNATATDKQSQGKSIEASAIPLRPQNSNLISGGTSNTAGGKAREATFLDGLKSIRLSDYKQIHEKPCVRDSLLTGIGAGFGVGGIRAILGARVLVSCNWAVGSFVCCSFLMHEYCQRKRIVEKQGIKRVVEVFERKKAEKQLQEADARDARRKGVQKEG